jgi:hypothetical protein
MSSGDGETTEGRERLRLWVKVALTLALLLVGGLRFARYDYAGTSFFDKDHYYSFKSDGGRVLENLNIDDAQYLSMVEDFRGVDRAFYKQVPYPEFADDPTATKGPVAPFINRPAIPYLSSLLPFDSPEAFATASLILLAVGLWALLDALRVQGHSAKSQFIGGALYVFSLPVLAFGAALYIDPGTVGMLMVGYWLITRRWWWAVVVFLPLSYLVKESLILLAPVAAMAWKASGRSFKRPAFVVGSVVSLAGWLVVGRVVQNLAPTPVLSYSVAPKLSVLVNNLGAPVSTIFFVVGCAPVVVPALLQLWRMVEDGGWRSLLRGPASPDVVGFATVALINIYSLVGTDLTLRTGWLFWPFAISLTCRWVDSTAIAERLGPLPWLGGEPAVSGSGSSSR